MAPGEQAAQQVAGPVPHRGTGSQGVVEGRVVEQSQDLPVLCMGGGAEGTGALSRDKEYVAQRAARLHEAGMEPALPRLCWEEWVMSGRGSASSTSTHSEEKRMPNTAAISPLLPSSSRKLAGL